MEVELLEEILGLFFLPYFSFLFKIYLFQLEDNFFIILCWFLPYININQPSVYICPLPGGSMVKYLIANAGDTGLTPVAGLSPGEGNGNPLQYSYLGNPMDRGVEWSIVHGAAKESDMT